MEVAQNYCIKRGGQGDQPHPDHDLTTSVSSIPQSGRGRFGLSLAARARRPSEPLMADVRRRPDHPGAAGGSKPRLSALDLLVCSTSWQTAVSHPVVHSRPIPPPASEPHNDARRTWAEARSSHPKTFSTSRRRCRAPDRSHSNNRSASRVYCLVVSGEPLRAS